MTGIICVPAGETLRHSIFLQALRRLQRPADVMELIAVGSSVAENRNLGIETAITGGAKWILYIDDDMLPGPETLTRLLKIPAPIVSALYVSRRAPHPPLAFHEADSRGAVKPTVLTAEDRGPKAVAAVGAGCLLVRQQVWQTLTAPVWRLGQIKADEWCDDLDFCSRATNVGLDIICDYSTPCTHITSYQATPFFDAAAGWTTQLARDNVVLSIPAAREE